MATRRETDPWKAHRDDLLRQADGKLKAYGIPMGRRLLLYPVKPDEKRIIEVVELQKHLPDMGLVLGVGWGCNDDAMEQLQRIYEGVTIPSEVLEAACYARGDVLLINRFSGMGVPGTELLVVRTEDVFMKLTFGFSLRLVGPGERTDEMPAPQAPSLVRVAPAGIVPGR